MAKMKSMPRWDDHEQIGEGIEILEICVLS